MTGEIDEARARISPIPAFDDNYIWLLRDPGRRLATLVDPGDADPVVAALADEDLALAAILITHHHPDHTGGVLDLLAAFPDALVFGPQDRRIPGLNRPVSEGDEVRVPGHAEAFRVLEVPGHTATHIAFLGGRTLFCGDTLFAAGCGRVFDGTVEQLARSLARLAALPPDTLCYCAHEYTLANLGFAAWVEPNNAARQERQREVESQRARHEPTVPSSLALELATNPFLRTGEPVVVAAAERFAGMRLQTQAEVFAALRRWKDTCYD
ncbi:hydroxyacylglutathione hydrolase [Thioalkalicoccus limnaeus]|uniref:Hydroxyacylglutathione hydrolase n=1 Tax=Thioalkalicoccus limnaeus TaxID=120681 RepID=A0ABV4BFK6_9GAMM